MENNNLEIKITKELVKSFGEILEKNKVDDDVTIIACAMSFITYVLAGSQIEVDDFLDFLKKEMPKKVNCIENILRNGNNRDI